MTDKQLIQIVIGGNPESPLGPLWVALSADGLWCMDFGIDEAEFVRHVQARGPVEISYDTAKTAAALAEMQAYLAGELRDFSLAVDWWGMNDFQVAVSKAVMAIPTGSTASYGAIAEQVGRPGAARAVGRVNATNPIPLLIPCHRVIAANGHLTGYGGAGGLKTKEWLLQLEGVRLF